MAAGVLPTVPLSVNDINVAFYSTANQQSLSGLATVASISKPVAISDFTGTYYCCVKPQLSTLTWDWDEVTSKDNRLQIVPFIDFKIFYMPSWASVYASDNCTISIGPTQVNSAFTKTGRVCVCSCTGGYGTSYFTMTHYSA